MDNSNTYNDLGVLYVDKETLNLKYFRRAFERQFPVFVVNSVQLGYDVLRKNDIGLILAEQYMPRQTGLEFLSRVHHLCPNIMRILVTTNINPILAKQALASRTMHQYIYKPWDLGKLEELIRNSLKR